MYSAENSGEPFAPPRLIDDFNLQKMGRLAALTLVVFTHDLDFHSPESASYGFIRSQRLFGNH